jgi:hypothetical protein
MESKFTKIMKIFENIDEVKGRRVISEAEIIGVLFLEVSAIS